VGDELGERVQPELRVEPVARGRLLGTIDERQRQLEHAARAHLRPDQLDAARGERLAGRALAPGEQGVGQVGGQLREERDAPEGHLAGGEGTVGRRGGVEHGAGDVAVVEACGQGGEVGRGPVAHVRDGRVQRAEAGVRDADEEEHRRRVLGLGLDAEAGDHAAPGHIDRGQARGIGQHVPRGEHGAGGFRARSDHELEVDLGGRERRAVHIEVTNFQRARLGERQAQLITWRYLYFQASCRRSPVRAATGRRARIGAGDERAGEDQTRVVEPSTTPHPIEVT
jgi:hypothetical protein